MDTHQPRAIAGYHINGCLGFGKFGKVRAWRIVQMLNCSRRSSPRPPPHPSPPSKHSRTHTLVRFFCSNTLSQAYHATKIASGETVALKLIKRAEMTARDHAKLQTEVAALRAAALHPNIVTLVDFHEEAAKPKKRAPDVTIPVAVIAMELCPGGELMDYLPTEKYEGHAPFSEPLARTYFLQLLSALGHAHSCGVVHRDIKVCTGANRAPPFKFLQPCRAPLPLRPPSRPSSSHCLFCSPTTCCLQRTSACVCATLALERLRPSARPPPSCARPAARQGSWPQRSFVGGAGGRRTPVQQLTSGRRAYSCSSCSQASRHSGASGYASGGGYRVRRCRSL
jgi:hypothetical protein